jgi:hypothetical protein
MSAQSFFWIQQLIWEKVSWILNKEWTMSTQAFFTTRTLMRMDWWDLECHFLVHPHESYFPLQRLNPSWATRPSKSQQIVRSLRIQSFVRTGLSRGNFYRWIRTVKWFLVGITNPSFPRPTEGYLRSTGLKILSKEKTQCFSPSVDKCLSLGIWVVLAS